MCNILKAKTYNWLPNTHTHRHTHTHTRNSNNYKQKATGHVISLANGHFTCAKFRPLRVTETEIILLTASGDARRLWSNEGMYVWSVRWFSKRHKTDASTNLEDPTIRAACTPQTVLGRHFWCLFCFFNQYLAIFTAISVYSQQKRAYSALHPQALTECSPLDFRRSSIVAVVAEQ